ncbi:uncharacterized protein LOC124671770 [Lolium rigidum]|uniref:uncharacterized protein LOC124671770 n=1 Tax=Lolium rigidum TaxID=89674 RepID=UPI001F5D0CD3|nr:uncharacterized protein LOC124671770 [Lolium rigidum]
MYPLASFNRTWRPFGTKNWEMYMPPPRPQPHGLLTGAGLNGLDSYWDGSCCVQSFSESVTARLRIWYEKEAELDEDLWYDPASFEVNLTELIHMAAAHGVLTQTGSSEIGLGLLAATVGIPLEGYLLPYHHQRSPPTAGRTTYAHGITSTLYKAAPLQLGATTKQIEASMAYREHLCDCIDRGPFHASFRVQSHYFQRRPPLEPYTRRWDAPTRLSRLSRQEESIQPEHSITLYGYDCPNGNVSSLVENALVQGHTPEQGLARRHVIDAEAIDWYAEPDVSNVSFNTTLGRFPEDTRRPKSKWEDVVDSFQSLLS